MSDIEAALASAVTDDDARSALHAAIRELWPEMPSYPSPEQTRWRDCIALLDGPSAGWIGVGVLMGRQGWAWTLGMDTGYLNPPDEYKRAWARMHPKQRQELGTGNVWAIRPDCALVLASLAALRAKAPA